MAWRSLGRDGRSLVHVWGSRLGINHSYCLPWIGNGNLDYLASRGSPAGSRLSRKSDRRCHGSGMAYYWELDLQDGQEGLS